MRKMNTCKINTLCSAVLLIVYTFISTVAADAQVINRREADSLINVISTKLTDQYPFTEISILYTNTLQKKLAAGKYYNLSEDGFAKQVTSDLQAAHKDVHLRIYKDIPVTPVAAGTTLNSSASSKNSPAINSPEVLKNNNYGFQAVEQDRITSTTYIDIPGPMFPTQETFDMAANAMNMAAYSKYIIIDLRENPGGSGEIGRFLASYFYEPGEEKYYLYGFHKDKAKDEQEWTYGYVPGKRNIQAKLYILTSRHTASAAEGMAYAMQKLKRATIIGDTTAGAGIAGSDFDLKDQLRMFLPIKMVVAPYTTAGWEGTGVIPDIVTYQGDALLTTRSIILNDIIKTDSSSVRKEAAEWLIADKTSKSLADRQNYAGIENYAVAQNYTGLAGLYTDGISITRSKYGYSWNNIKDGKITATFKLKEVKSDVFTVVSLYTDYRTCNARIYIERDRTGKIDHIILKALCKDGSIRVSPIQYKHI